jgi:hypothetical protein
MQELGMGDDDDEELTKLAMKELGMGSKPSSRLTSKESLDDDELTKLALADLDFGEDEELSKLTAELGLSSGRSKKKRR